MKKLSRDEMKKIKGGGHETCGGGSSSCNPGPYYRQSCTTDANCWGPTQTCKGTLYCYISGGAKLSTGTCLFC